MKKSISPGRESVVKIKKKVSCKNQDRGWGLSTLTMARAGERDQEEKRRSEVRAGGKHAPQYALLLLLIMQSQENTDRI